MLRTLVVLLLTVTSVARAQTVVYVNGAVPASGDGAAWATAFRFLQDGLAKATALAGAGDTVQVWIAAGTYYPDRSESAPDGSGDAAASFVMASRVEILGGFAGGETDVVQRDPTANVAVLTAYEDATHAGSGRILAADSVDSTALLDGVTVSNPSPPSGFGFGKGMRLVQSSPRVRGCVIRDCHTPSGVHAGGVYCEGGAPLFEDCRFLSNRAAAPSGRGGAIYSVNSILTVKRCIFEGNNGDGGGGGIYELGGSSLVEDCVFTGNETHDWNGGALLLGPDSIVRRCTFRDNSGYNDAQALYGAGRIEDCEFIRSHGTFASSGAAVVTGPVTMINCLFVGNWISDYSRATVEVRGPSTIADCTIVSSYYYGLALASGETRISNCIFWRTGSSQEAEHIYLELGATVSIDHSFVPGWTGQLGGAGNLGAYPYADPLFVDDLGPDGQPDTGDEDLRLRPGSPCIDAGNNGAVPTGITTDLDGHARFFDDSGTIDVGVGPVPVVDMGAYEFSGTTCRPDVNRDGQVTAADADTFVAWFEAGNPAADYNRDGFNDGIDYDEFNNDFEVGC